MSYSDLIEKGASKQELKEFFAGGWADRNNNPHPSEPTRRLQRGGRASRNELLCIPAHVHDSRA